MATRKKTNKPLDGAGSILSTIAGPSDPRPPTSLGTKDPVAARLLEKVVTQKTLSAEIAFNATKPLEYGDDARSPHPGQVATPESPLATASTSTEHIASPKAGDGWPKLGANSLNSSLDRVRVDDTGQRLTSNQGVPVSDNQDSLKIGLRGPTAFEDFLMREKITTSAFPNAWCMRAVRPHTATSRPTRTSAP
jgi:catalase